MITKKMPSTNTSLHTTRLERNTKLFPIFELLRSLIFTIPIWVAYELQYISLSQLALVESIIFASQLFLELPSGAFADLAGRRTSLAIGMILTVLSLIVYAQATTMIMFVYFGIIVGAADSFISGSREAMIYDTYKELNKEGELIKAYSRNNLFTQGGLAISSILGGALSVFDIKLPIYFQITAFAANIGLAFMLYEPSIDTHKYRLNQYITQLKVGIAETTKNTFVRNFSLFYILVGGITWSSILAINNMWLTIEGFSEQTIGTLLGLGRIINGLVLFWLVKQKTVFTKSRSLLIFSTCLLLILLPGYWLKGWAILPIVIVTMFFSSARWTVLSTYLNQHYASSKRATANSALSMMISLFYIVMVFVAGKVGETSHNLGVVYTFFGLIGLFILFPLSRKLRSGLAQTHA